MLLFINEKCFWNEWFAFVRLALAIWVYRGAINATRRQENDDGQALEINRCYFNHREKPLVSPLEKWSTNGGISTSMFVYRKDQEGTCFGWDDLVQIKKTSEEDLFSNNKFDVCKQFASDTKCKTTNAFTPISIPPQDTSVESRLLFFCVVRWVFNFRDRSS